MEGDVRPPKRLRTTEESVNTKTDEFANYDVFISHRGPDTKTGFVGFLYKDLVAAGLQPFLDCKSIDIGDDSWECIEHAIKRTPLALVVFSESFARSEWCLRELHVMLHTPSVKVLPVFYNVRPSEVRFPESGRLKDGFEKLASRHHHNNIIEQWRADLDQASKTMGWEHSGADRRLEVDLVKAVVGKICELAKKPLPLDVGEYVVGVEEVAVEIMKKLEKEKHLLMLGLWGMGGIGKSTLAKELYNQMRNMFGVSCFIENVTDKVSQAGGVVKVQNRILKGLCKNESLEIEDKSEGKVLLEERLSKTKALLVLDDVHDEVGDNNGIYYWISRKMLAEGSMCIVTSRNSRVFQKLNSFDIKREVYIHNVQGLSNVNSKRMFSSFAFGGYWTVKQDFEELVENISKACGGVPLVVKVCGSLLKQEENVKIWQEVLEKLNTGRIMGEIDIFGCLQISYNYLNEELQEMFLDVACALLGKPEGWAKRTWSYHHMSSTLGVRTLVEKALITVDKTGCLSMHDHLRDMGREIVRKKRTREGVIRRLWMPESLSVLKRNEESLDNLRTLMIFNQASCIDLDVPHMKDLRTMICDGSINWVVQSLPETLSWFDCEAEYDIDEEVLENLPEIPHVNNLVILNLKGSNIGTLSDSIGNASTLQVMNLEDTWSLFQLPDSFGRLKNLEDLNLSSSGIQSLPESFGGLSNLEVLNMNSCGELTSLPVSFGGLKKLQDINLRESGIQSLPESFGGLSNLEVLNMNSCGELTSLPVSFGGLRKLRDIYLEYSGIRSLPESFGGLSNLEVLDVGSCRGLTSLPDSFGSLRKLRSLTIEGSRISCLPESVTRLKSLDLCKFYNYLIRLPNPCKHLKIQRELKFTSLRVQSLPESYGELIHLEVLNLSSCRELVSLPNSFGGLKNLRDLNLAWSGIQSLPESFGELSNLEVLNLSSCRELVSLPHSFGSLKKLRDVNLGGSRVKDLPDSFGGLSNLEDLNLSSCHELMSLPDSLGGLGNLRALRLDYSGIECLPESFRSLSSLERLDMSECHKLIKLPDSFGSLCNLRDLNLRCSSLIEILPSSFGGLSNLEELNLWCCENLIMLPDSFRSLRKLRTLTLGWTKIENLPESFGELSNLQELDLNYCSGLKALPQSCTQLRNLQMLDLQDCPASLSFRLFQHRMPANCVVLQ